MKHRLPEPTVLTRAAFITAFAAVGFTMAYLITMYPDLPIALPVNLLRGRPVIHSYKTPTLVMMPVMVQLALLACIVPLVGLLLWRARPDDPSTAPHTERMRLIAEGVAAIGVVWVVVQGFTAVRLVALWERGRGDFGDVYTLVLATAVMLSIVLGARTMALLKEHQVRQVVPDNPSVWRWKRLYVNPDDPSLFAPARDGMSYTLNFGRPAAIVVMLGIFGFGVIGPSYVVFNILQGYWY